MMCLQGQKIRCEFFRKSRHISFLYSAFQQQERCGAWRSWLPLCNVITHIKKYGPASDQAVVNLGL
jgi:hypothetical protein